MRNPYLTNRGEPGEHAALWEALRGVVDTRPREPAGPETPVKDRDQKIGKLASRARGQRRADEKQG